MVYIYIYILYIYYIYINKRKKNSTYEKIERYLTVAFPRMPLVRYP